MEQSKRWAVVTGASSGIGRATALHLGAAGWNVVVHYHRLQGPAEEAAAQLRQMGRESVTLAADVSDADAARALVDAAWDVAGGIDAWVQNAGADVLTGPAARLSFQEKLDRVTRVDLWGTVFTCRAIGARMKQRGHGSIVTIGWDHAASGMAGDTPELFAAVKGGIASFSRCLAKSLAPSVRVNCVAPGWIRTKWGETASQHWQDRAVGDAPLARWGTPEDVANTIGFLLSEQASFLTGQTILVNGGAVTS